MDRLKRRGPAVLLAVCMVLGLLAGCGKKEGGGAQQLSETVYVPKFMDLGVDLAEIRGGCAGDTYIYFVGMEEVRTEHVIPGTDETYTDLNYVSNIYRIPLEGGKAEKLPNYEAPVVPAGYNGSADIGEISLAADGTLWVNENVYIWGRADDQYGIMDDMLVDMPAVASSSIVFTRDAAAVPDVAVDEDWDGYDPNLDPETYDEAWYEDFSAMNTSVRRHLAEDGSELERVDMSNIAEKLDMEYVYNATFSDDGTFYVTTETELLVLDKDMNTRFTLELPTNNWPRIVSLGGGKVCIFQYSYDEAAQTSGYKLTMIDTEKQAWGEEYLLPSSAYSIYPGGGDYLFYYQVNDAIFGWRADAPADAEAGERLFAWIEADINSDTIQNFTFLPDGRVAAITREWVRTGDESHVELGAVIMTATPRSQLPEKTTLVYGTMYLNYADRRRIIDFNKTSDKYRIEVKDYSEYNTGADSGAGLQKLNTEIVAGVVPDILCTSEMPAKQYAAKGVLEDLWPFIDNDPDLGRNRLMIRPLEVSQVDGKLYELFGDFAVRTVVGATDVVGDRMSWTLADLNEALASMPEGCAVFGVEDTKDGMLSNVLRWNADTFVDWDSGKCYFDTDNFRSLLEFCNSFQTDFNYEDVDWDEWESTEMRILSGKQMLSMGFIGSFGWSFQSYQVIFPDGLSYIGLPMEDGSVGSSFYTGTTYAISSTCADKDGAWSFLRQNLLPKGEDDYYYGNFPVNKADFDKQMEEAMTPDYALDENGEPYLDANGEPIIYNVSSMWLNDGTEIKFHLPTQAEIDRFMGLYNVINSMSRYDESIYEIVSDVAGAYFAGDKDLDETARLIQNKANLYVNETK